jgi:hypothetical protein
VMNAGGRAGGRTDGHDVANRRFSRHKLTRLKSRTSHTRRFVTYYIPGVLPGRHQTLPLHPINHLSF